MDSDTLCLMMYLPDRKDLRVFPAMCPNTGLTTVELTLTFAAAQGQDWGSTDPNRDPKGQVPGVRKAAAWPSTSGFSLGRANLDRRRQRPAPLGLNACSFWLLSDIEFSFPLTPSGPHLSVFVSAPPHPDPFAFAFQL